MKISVVVPVYNAETFLRTAVESAVTQPETGEILLIEDGSKDGSLRVCRELAEEYPLVRVLQHSPPGNRGAGASRNLGIVNARHDLIAFLDADDYYLPSRFAESFRFFSSDREVDGVLETVGTDFSNDQVRRDWLESGRPAVTGFREPVAPEQLFEAQGPVGTGGYAHINGWLIRKTAFDKTGLFDERLRLHQDSAMAVKLSALCRMVVGDVSRPVAMRRVHADNRISAKRSPARRYREFLRMWRVLWEWGGRNLDSSRRTLLLKRYLTYAAKPFTTIDSDLNRLAIVPSLQLIYALAQDGSLYGEPYFRQQFAECLDNFKACLGWGKA